MNSIYIQILLSAVIALGIHAEEHDHHEHDHEENLIGKLNPGVSAVIDALYYNENSKDGLGNIKDEMPGFGHPAHGDEEHAHGNENGFNLREVEVTLTAELDGILNAETTLAFAPHEIELETAFVETTGLSGGLALKGGKFFSDFGIVNKQHPHEWAFTDQPLIYELTLGDHGLNELGLQASWTAPLPFYLKVGVEALQGENEALFAQEDDSNLPSHSGPRLGVAWLKTGPDLGHRHTLEFGLFGGQGTHQEIHEETAGTNNYFDGNSYFAGGDLLYHLHAHGEQGQGDFVLQAEYFQQNKALDLLASDDSGTTPGGNLDSNQDGYYLQGLYGFLPKWRGGLRWDQVGLINEVKESDAPDESFGDSWRATAMLDFNPIPSTLIRLQASNGDYETATGTQNVWEGYVQIVVTIGSHKHADEHACSGH
ncbi:MAG: TonB-dependent receptor [Pontiella sp.]